jgi:hypothetical protein
MNLRYIRSTSYTGAKCMLYPVFIPTNVTSKRDSLVQFYVLQIIYVHICSFYGL